MAKGGYIGINGVARKAKGGYIGVNGVARKVKKMYIGVNGVARLCWENIESTAYVEFTSPNSFTVSCSKNWDGTLEYNNGNGWTVWDGSEISGTSIKFRGINNTIITGENGYRYTWAITGSNVACSGNIETLLDYATVEAGGHPEMGSNCYMSMFQDCTALTTAPELPATTLASYCYQEMFYGCTALTIAPELPATTLGNACYRSMFQDCTGLTTASSLPATELATECYLRMFRGCTSLTAIPKLPATTLRTTCYSEMFYGCTSVQLSKIKYGSLYPLEYRIPTLGTGTTATDALSEMFESTGGAFTGTPTINTTYYLHSSNSIV